MSDALYGLDPELIDNGRVTRRSVPDPNVVVGLGSPRQFPFGNWNALDPVWWAESPPPGWSLNHSNGLLQFAAQNAGSGYNQWLRVAVDLAFDLANMVTIAFRIRAYAFRNTTEVKIELAAGIFLRLTNNGTASYWANALDSGAPLNATSSINTNSGWVDVVMLLTSQRVVLWENGNQVFSIDEYPGNAGATLYGQATGNAVRATFMVQLLDQNANAMIELAQVSVTAATDSPVHLANPTTPPSNQNTTLTQLAALIPAISAAAGPLSQALKSIGDDHIGAWAMVFGYDPDSQAKNTAAQIVHNTAVQQFINTASQAHALVARDNGVKSGSTFYLGLGMSAAFFVAGGYSLGFLFDVSKSPVQIALVVNFGLGGGIAAGISGHLDVGWYPLSIDDISGWGASLFIDGGELVVVSFSVSGNIPLHLTTWDNCGPVITAGVGVGIPIEAGGLVSRTFVMSRW